MKNCIIVVMFTLGTHTTITDGGERLRKKVCVKPQELTSAFKVVEVNKYEQEATSAKSY